MITLAYFLGPPILIYSIQRFRRDMQLLEFDPASIPNSGIIEQFFDEFVCFVLMMSFTGMLRNSCGRLFSSNVLMRRLPQVTFSCVTLDGDQRRTGR
ncbi:MAG: hypothetical protein WKF77_07695 [Planctomycetaceae bacterium]